MAADYLLTALHYDGVHLAVTLLPRSVSAAGPAVQTSSVDCLATDVWLTCPASQSVCYSYSCCFVIVLLLYCCCRCCCVDCDPHCSGGCITQGPGKCDGTCISGYVFISDSHTCEGKKHLKLGRILISTKTLSLFLTRAVWLICSVDINLQQARTDYYQF